MLMIGASRVFLLFQMYCSVAKRGKYTGQLGQKSRLNFGLFVPVKLGYRDHTGMGECLSDFFVLDLEHTFGGGALRSGKYIAVFCKVG